MQECVENFESNRYTRKIGENKQQINVKILGTKRDCFFMATTKDRYPWRVETQINIKGLNQKHQSNRTEFLKCA